MALLRTKISEVPPDAIILSEEEALAYQCKILKKWKNPTDVMAYKYGSYLLGGASFLSGLFINSYYRNKFKLFHYGRAASYLPVCVIPATFSTIMHIELVLKDILLQKRENCPICLELRASALQSTLGCVFPTVLGITSTLALAQRYVTYDIPYITKEPMKVFNLVKTTIKPIGNTLCAIFLGQALFASAITYFETQSVITVNKKLALLEHQLENS